MGEHRLRAVVLRVHARVQLALLCAVALLFACSGFDPVREPIRIGIFQDLSGDAAAVGLSFVNAVQLVAREVNAAGGLLEGRPLEVDAADDRSQPERAAQLASEMKEDGVVGFVGPVLSATATAVQKVAAEDPPIPLISCCATSPSLTGLPSFFRTAPSDEQQAETSAELARTCGCQRLAVLYVPDAYGTPLSALIEQDFVKLKGKVVARVALDSDAASYSDQLTALHKHMPDCITLVLFTGAVGTVLRDWKDLTSDPVRFIGTDSVYAADLEPNTGDAQLLDGLIGTTPRTQPSTPAFERYQAAYQFTYSKDVQPGTSAAYDAAALLVLAIERAKSTDGKRIMAQLRGVSRAPGLVLGPTELVAALAELRAGAELNYDGASGNVDLDAQGNVQAPYDIYRYDAKTSTVVRTPAEQFTCTP